MRRSIVAALLIFASTLAVVLSSSFPRGFAQTSSGPPVGDEFNSTSFQSPFTATCGHLATQPCPDAQGPLTWSLNTDSAGKLRIWTQFGSLLGTAANASNNARNMILQPVGSGSDYVATTALTFPAAATAGAVGLGQTAGVIVYQDDDNFIYVARTITTSGATQLQFLQEIAGSDISTTAAETNITPAAPVYLRITKVGSAYSASYSYDNVNFTQLPAASSTLLTPTATPTLTPTGTTTATPTSTPTSTPTITSYSAAYSTPFVGLFAWGGTNAAVTSNLVAADFDWFRVGVNSLTPAATATPTATGTVVATNTSTATATGVATATLTSTPTATATSTPTATPVPATPTNTPIPTPTPRPRPPARASFQWISVWYHVVRAGTFNHVEFQARSKTTQGIWAHVYFPSGRHYDWYTNTDSRGHWAMTFRIYRNDLSTRSNLAVITLRLWKGRTHRDANRMFTVIG